MILSIESSIPTFKSLVFKPGLNVLLADTAPGATERQTRNSAGKTSFVEIVHFLMGAKCEKDSLFRTPALLDATFMGTFRIGGDIFKVARSGSDPSKIFLLDGPHEAHGMPTKADKDSGRLFITNNNWRVVLGHEMFGMPRDPEGTAFDTPDAPSFRALISYFARRRASGGLLHPERQAHMQQRSDWQVNLSYLLGLDWELPQAFERIRTRELTLKELKRAAKGGALGNLVGTVAELRPQLAIAETKASRLREQLANFEVLDSYRDLSQRAARTRSEMQAIARETIALKETLEHLRGALAAEQAPPRTDLSRMYEAAGIELPGVALRRFEEVGRFHASVVSNRKAHLQGEIDRTGAQIADADRRLGELDAERRDTLKTLEGRGALEDFLSLQRDLAELDAAAAALRERYNAATMLEGEATQLELDRAGLKKRLQQDHEQRSDALNRAILLISEAIAALYEDRTGRFEVGATDNGPEFRISIEGDRGGGIASMEIFCLDLALFHIVHERFAGPGFLIHDSHLFDGVDERQIAIALQLGAAAAGEERQYIVTMNSDIFDRLPLPSEFDRDAVVLPTRLSDAGETGGLFGFRFD